MPRYRKSKNKKLVHDAKDFKHPYQLIHFFEVLKVFDNFSKDYFDNNELNFNRYSKLFHNAEIYLDSVMNKISELDLLKNSIILSLRLSFFKCVEKLIFSKLFKNSSFI